MSAKRRVSAVVLAAGASLRMGEPKQLLPLGGRTLLERALENLRGAELAQVVLVLGASADLILEALPASLLERLVVVRNPDYEQGIASSLRVGLAAVLPDSDAALVVLADQPFVRPATIARILERSRKSDSGSEAEIVIPFFQAKRGNPVLLARSLFAEAMALEGDSGFRVLFGNHADGIADVEVNDPGIVFDVDSREVYERLRRYFH
jgi:molybdenum cofactor cytidylyltransferase